MSDPNTPAPTAAWYPDPNDSAGLRWWDGHTWTTHTAPRPASHPIEDAEDTEVVDAGGIAAAVIADEPIEAPAAEPVDEIVTPTAIEPVAVESFLSRLEPLPSFTRTVAEEEPAQLPGITYPDPALADFAYPIFGSAPTEARPETTVAEALVAEMAGGANFDEPDPDAVLEPVASLPIVEVTDGPVADEFWNDEAVEDETVAQVSADEAPAVDALAAEPSAVPELKLVPVFLHQPEPTVAVEEPVVTIVDSSAFEEPDPARIALTLQSAPPPTGPAQPGRRMPSHLMPGAIPDAPRAIESSSTHRDVPRFRARARELAAASAS